MKTPTMFFLILVSAFSCMGQHQYPHYAYPDSVVVNVQTIASQSRALIHSRLKKINRYADRETKSTQKLLKKLSRKEARYLNKIKRKDSLADMHLGKSISYDSIRKLAQNTEAGKTYKKAKNSFNKKIDSLKGIADFANQKIAGVTSKLNQPELQGINTDKIDQLQEKLNVNEYVQQQIQGRTTALQNLGKTSKYTNGLTGINKQAYYYKQKLNAWKNIANDPGILEEKALEYLSGMQGFDKSVNANSFPLNGNGQMAMQQARSAEELEKMGYQTKRQVKAQMEEQFGMKTPEKAAQINTKFKEAKTQLTNYTSQLNTAKAQIKKLGFRPNPLRGLPWKQRLEKSLNWKLSKASGSSPAMLEMNGLLGYKHTPAFTHSLVFGGTLGLGKNWQNIRFTFEGFRIGANTDAKLIWGISAQAGFERLYKKYQQAKALTNELNTIQVVSQTKYYADIAYAGLQKTYKINSKYSGTLLLAYDFLWKQGNAQTPIIWRAGWKK